jgi:SM-20-related protein
MPSASGCASPVGMTLPAAELPDGLADTLATTGVVVQDGWLGHARAGALRAEVLELERRGCFEDAGVGQGARDSRALTHEVRRDRVCWFSTGDASPGMAAPAEMARLIVDLGRVLAWLNRTCYLGLGRLECHATSYQPGAFYRAHLDTPRGDSHRVISYCYYLNPGWQSGGELRIHGDHGVDLAPLHDRLVLFQSRTVRHEVLPVVSARLAITGWMTAATRG